MIHYRLHAAFSTEKKAVYRDFEEENPMSKVFFSQSIHDQRRHAIYSVLRDSFSEGNVWVAAYNLQPGEHWPKSMVLVLSASNLFVVLIPKEFSNTVLAECSNALLLGKFILPICNNVEQMCGYQLGNTPALIGHDSELAVLLIQWLREHRETIPQHLQTPPSNGISRWFHFHHQHH
jgi:hypothetical protein